MTQSIDPDTIWLTPEARQKLLDELAELKGPVRQEIISRISSARDEGDLKENGGYHAAKDDQGKVEARIRQLEEMLSRAEVGESLSADGSIAPGMVVTYKFAGDDDDEAETFLLGASENATDELKAYTPQSPLGSAILDHKAGETVTYEVNGRALEVQILEAKPYSG